MTEETLFADALKQPTPEARRAWLDRTCADQPKLRQRLEALLKAHDDAGSFLAAAAAVEAANTDAANNAESAAGNQNTPVSEPTLAESHAAAPSDLAFLAPSTTPGSLGRLAHYEILQVLGQGGFGVVLKARDTVLDRVVAIKVMSGPMVSAGMARHRFIREAKAAAAVTHDNVVTIHEVKHDDLPYLVMQYIHGQTLQDKLDRAGPLELKEILRIGMQIAAGLAAAHAQGLVHRDIKPTNILLENGVERVKITDFGLARAVDDASLTQSGVIAGTPQYMSPEQAQGEAVDHRADLFSLGSVLYALCTGHPPFRASGSMAVLKRVIEDAPRRVRESNPEIPEWLEAIIAKLHAKGREERFQSATEVAQLLGQHLAHVQQPALTPRPAPVAPLPVTPGLTSPPTTAAATTESSLPSGALARLKTPAIGLIITGVMYWLTVPVLFALRFLGPLDLEPYAKMPPVSDAVFEFLWMRLGIVPAFAGLVLLFAGWKMRHGEFYWFCVLSTCLPFVLMLEKLVTLREQRFAMALGDWTALPFGTWALIVLSRRDVREAFARVRTASSLLVGPAPAGALPTPARSEAAGPREALVGLGGGIVWAGMLFCYIFAILAALRGLFGLGAPTSFLVASGMSAATAAAALIVGRRWGGWRSRAGAIWLNAGCVLLTVALGFGVAWQRRSPDAADQSRHPEAPAPQFSSWLNAREFQGRWQVVSQEFEQRRLSDEQRVHWIEFKEDKLLMGRDGIGAEPRVQRVAFNTETETTQIDLYAVNGLVHEGVGIIRLDDDTVTLCVAEAGVSRPTQFTTAQGNSAKLTVARRLTETQGDSKLEQLRRLVDLKKQAVELAKRRFEAGVLPPNDVTLAEIDLLESQIRLAEAEQNLAAVTLFGRELVQRHEQRLEWTKKLFEAGRVTPTEVNKVEQELLQAKGRFPGAAAPPSKKAAPALGKKK